MNVNPADFVNLGGTVVVVIILTKYMMVISKDNKESNKDLAAALFENAKSTSVNSEVLRQQTIASSRVEEGLRRVEEAIKNSRRRR